MPSNPGRPGAVVDGKPAGADAVGAIRVSGLCKSFPSQDRRDGVPALCGVDIAIPAGQHVAVVGDSGSGKTTLLGCLSGRLVPTRGAVEIHHPVSTIHQDLRLVKQRTAIENVLDGALCRLSLRRTWLGFPQEERQRAAALLDRVGLADRATQRVSHLSGGEQQRVAIARSLMQNPKILLADEPIASLDRSNAHDIMTLLGALRSERQLTLVSVLHDRALAQTYADRIVGLRDGRLVYDSDNTPRIRTAPAATDTPDGERTASPSATPAVEPAPSPSTFRRNVAWAVAIPLITALYALSIITLDVGPRSFEGIGRNLARFFTDLAPSSMAEIRGIPWTDLLVALAQTLGMSLLGTTLGVLVAWPLAALGARNVGPPLVRPAVRFLLNAIRTVPSLIWALLFVAAVGLGPFAGVLALTAYSVGYLTKFFYEAFEAVDQGPPGALREIGASGLQTFHLSIWPASRPAIASSSLFMFEYNVRAASVLGLVGAGGIGYWFSIFFNWRNYTAAGACLLLLLIVVLILDTISTRLRARMVVDPK